jgi:hypothetical protein
VTKRLGRQEEEVDGRGRVSRSVQVVDYNETTVGELAGIDARWP